MSDPTSVSVVATFRCGHPRTQENTARVERRNGSSYEGCRICKRQKSRARRERRGAQPRVPFRSLEAFLAAHIVQEGSHQLWTGYCVRPKNAPSYPYSTVVLKTEAGERQEVRVAPRRKLWEERFGPVPKGQRLYNTCGNERCIEPTHQEPRAFDGAIADEDRRRGAANRVARQGSLLQVIRKRLTRGWCWEWNGSLNDSDHGNPTIEYQGRKYYVRRVLWEAEYGKPPQTKLKCRCHNPRCVKPQHMRDPKAPALPMPQACGPLLPLRMAQGPIRVSGDPTADKPLPALLKRRA